MKKNAKIRIIVTKEKLDEIKSRAKLEDTTMSCFCLRKINASSEMQRIEFMFEKISSKLDELRKDFSELSHHK